MRGYLLVTTEACYPPHGFVCHPINYRKLLWKFVELLVPIHVYQKFMEELYTKIDNFMIPNSRLTCVVLGKIAIPSIPF